MKRGQEWKLLKLMVLALVAGALSAGLANAQDLSGRFTLPFEAHWGPATLPAGNYSFTLNRNLSGLLLVCVSRGARNVALITNNRGYSMEPSGPDELTVVRDRTGNTVSEMRLPAIGMVLYYSPLKSKRAAQERAMVKMIPVTLAGK